MTSSPEDRGPWKPGEAISQPSAPPPTGDWPLPPASETPGNGNHPPASTASPAPDSPIPDSSTPDSPIPVSSTPDSSSSGSWTPDSSASASWTPAPPQVPLPIIEPPRFAEFQPPPPPPARIPNFGHFCLVIALAVVGLLCTSVVLAFALHRHLYGVATKEQAVANIHYTLGSEALLYLFTLAACLVIFPLIWHKGFFAGVQWNAAIALRLRWRLLSAAGICLLLAFADSVLVPGPSNAPIDKIFREPGAAWLLFGFGVTFAPFFEELLFRGFLLPALCTAYDWFRERFYHQPILPLGENGHPQWSMPAMVVGSILTSLPFAALHAQQTGYSAGPFVLLVGVSIVLCGIRLSTRSLASSVLVHSSYNFMLFAIMLVGTHGFRHFGKF